MSNSNYYCKYSLLQIFPPQISKFLTEKLFHTIKFKDDLKAIFLTMKMLMELCKKDRNKNRLFDL
jgi:hypothetical protein